MEYENHYASKGWAALNTVLGSIGTAGTTGILDKLLGSLGGCKHSDFGAESLLMTIPLWGAIAGMSNNNSCGNYYVTGREAALAREIADKDGRIGHLESTIYTDSKIADVYERLNNKIGIVEAQMSQQAVYNATNSSVLSCIQGQIANLMALTKTVIPIDSICPTPAVATT